MNLRKWVSNVETLNDDANDKSERKILGLKYNPSEDVIGIEDVNLHDGETITKRFVLQSIASVYDPMGIIAPITAKLKIFMQKVTRLNSG